MINYLAGEAGSRTVAFLGILFAFAATCLTMYKGMNLLPKDHGRDFAVDGKKSAGKPRGAGFLFVLVFIAAALLFARPGREMVIYLILVGAAMLTGFLDDCAKTPWGEYKKGLLDLVIAVMTAVTFLNFNSSEVSFLLTGRTVVLPPVLFAVLAVVLVWVSINVTNCSDGVDGLSGTLTIITLMTIFRLHPGLSVVQRHAEPPDDGRRGLPRHGPFHQHRRSEDGKPFSVYPGGAGADPGRRTWSCEGIPSSFPEDPDPDEGPHPPA